MCVHGTGVRPCLLEMCLCYSFELGVPEVCAHTCRRCVPTHAVYGGVYIVSVHLQPATSPYSSDNYKSLARGNFPISRKSGWDKSQPFPCPASHQGCPHRPCLDFFCLSPYHCHTVPPSVPVCFGRTRYEIWLVNRG